MFHLISPDLKFDFLGKSKPFVLLSTIAALASIAGIFYPGLNYGIDFTGGAEVQVRVPKDWQIGRLRDSLEKGGLKEAKVVQIGEAKDHEFLIKMQANPEALNQVSSKVSSILSAQIDTSQNAKRFEILRTDVVGPQAGASLRMSAFLSILYALIAISIYITFRFDVRYAPGVIRALGVDVVITVGAWILMQREFNLTVLASLLTIAGYSCNDTIVIYDRIRDFTKSHPDWSLDQAINKSINLNLGRTILTTGATLFVVLSMYFLGGPVLEDFSLPLLIGFTVSIPSTLFVANPMILYMEKRRIAKLKAMQSGGHSSKKSGSSSRVHA
jgi:preprotein translocase subunit SecF